MMAQTESQLIVQAKEAQTKKVQAKEVQVNEKRAAGKKNQLSLVVPCFNESEVLQQFYQETTVVLHSLSGFEYELIFVDDGSSDDTLLQINAFAAQNDRVKVISLARNFGSQIAFTAGIDHANGDVVITMDADLQHPPSMLPTMLEQWQAGYEIVSCMRQNTHGASWIKDLTSNAFYKLFNMMSPIKIPEGASDFCLISSKVCDVLRDMPERHRFLRGMVAWTGFSRVTLPFDVVARAAGEPSYTPAKLITLAMDAIVSFSAQPLRLALRMGLVMAALGFIYLFWNIVAGFINGNLVPGYASLIGVTVTLGGCQLAFIGLIGEYLARVFEEVKGRPIYSMKQSPNSQQGFNRQSKSEPRP